MTELDKHWLAGVLDSRGTINVTKGSNVSGVVTLNFHNLFMKDLVESLLTNWGIEVSKATIVGKTIKLNFSSARGSRLLSLLVPYCRNPEITRRADVYVRIFPESLEGKHMKLDRLERYVDWLHMLRDEETDDVRSLIKDKL